MSKAMERSSYSETSLLEDEQNESSSCLLFSMIGVGVTAVVATIVLVVVCCCGETKKENMTTCGDFIKIDANKNLCDATSILDGADKIKCSADLKNKEACNIAKCCVAAGPAPPAPDKTKALLAPAGTTERLLQETDDIKTLKKALQTVFNTKLQEIKDIKDSKRTGDADTVKYPTLQYLAALLPKAADFADVKSLDEVKNIAQGILAKPEMWNGEKKEKNIDVTPAKTSARLTALFAAEGIDTTTASFAGVQDGYKKQIQSNHGAYLRHAAAITMTIVMSAEKEIIAFKKVSAKEVTTEYTKDKKDADVAKAYQAIADKLKVWAIPVDGSLKVDPAVIAAAYPETHAALNAKTAVEVVADAVLAVVAKKNADGSDFAGVLSDQQKIINEIISFNVGEAMQIKDLHHALAKFDIEGMDRVINDMYTVAVHTVQLSPVEGPDVKKTWVFHLMNDIVGAGADKESRLLYENLGYYLTNEALAFADDDQLIADLATIKLFAGIAATDIEGQNLLMKVSGQSPDVQIFAPEEPKKNNDFQKTLTSLRNPAFGDVFRYNAAKAFPKMFNTNGELILGKAEAGRKFSLTEVSKYVDDILLGNEDVVFWDLVAVKTLFSTPKQLDNGEFYLGENSGAGKSHVEYTRQTETSRSVLKNVEETIAAYNVTEKKHLHPEQLKAAADDVVEALKNSEDLKNSSKYLMEWTKETFDKQTSDIQHGVTKGPLPLDLAAAVKDFAKKLEKVLTSAELKEKVTKDVLAVGKPVEKPAEAKPAEGEDK